MQKAKKERASFNFGGSLKAKPKAEVAAPAVVMTAPKLSASAPAVKVKAPKEPKVRAPREKKEWKFDWKWGLGDVKLGGRWKTRKPKTYSKPEPKVFVFYRPGRAPRRQAHRSPKFIFPLQ